MKKIAFIFLAWSCLNPIVRASDSPRAADFLFSAKASDTRQTAVFVAQGKKNDDVVSVTTSAVIFKEPQEFSLEGKPPVADEPVLSFVIARQLWKKGDDVRYLDYWHSTAHKRIRAMMAKTHADAVMSQRLAAARAAAKTVTVLGVVQLAQGQVVVIREQGKVEAHFMIGQSGRWRLADLVGRSVNDLSSAIIEAAFAKGSITPVVAPAK